jgi:hypothetical protein
MYFLPFNLPYRIIFGPVKKVSIYVRTVFTLYFQTWMRSLPPRIKLSGVMNFKQSASPERPKWRKITRL